MKSGAVSGSANALSRGQVIARAAASNNVYVLLSPLAFLALPGHSLQVKLGQLQFRLLPDSEGGDLQR